MHLVSLAAHRVRIGACDLEVDFDEGETIHTEDSRKYDVALLDRLARLSGFVRSETWYDAARRFSSSLFAAVD
jgi:uncharacterized SAM-dependent methyltransferase